MTAKQFFTLAGVILLIVLGSIGYALKGGKAPEAKQTHTTHISSQSAPPPSTQKSDSSTHSTATADSSVTKTGTVECVPMNSDNPIQTTSCAIGLRSDEGEHYAMYTEDPTTVGMLPTGQRVQVTGTLEQTNRYGLAGIIDVTTIERL